MGILIPLSFPRGREGFNVNAFKPLNWRFFIQLVFTQNFGKLVGTPFPTKRLSGLSYVAIFRDTEMVMSTTFLNSKMDPRTIAASDDDALPAVLDRHGDMTWLKKAEARISQILKTDKPTIEDKKDLQVFSSSF